MTFGGGRYFIVPTGVFLFALLLANPISLFAIFSSSKLLQETRYKLLANTLITDLLYSFICFALTATNISPVIFPDLLCEILLSLQTVVFFSGFLNITAMGVNIYLAINWPLQYNSIFTPSRAVKLIVTIWLLSSIIPLVSYILLSGDQGLLCDIPVCFFNILFFLPHPNPVVQEMNYVAVVVMCTACSVLVFVCFYLLVWRTRKSGIWTGMHSKARQTITIHCLIFSFYFLPTIIMVIQRVLLSYRLMHIKSMLYVTMTVSNVVLLIPKALTPYLHGFRCEELSVAIQSLLKGRSQISPSG
ncbi:GP148 protein, partial [Amia calva]|nr:GP148 protein [Amia calva]